VSTARTTNASGRELPIQDPPYRLHDKIRLYKKRLEQQHKSGPPSDVSPRTFAGTFAGTHGADANDVGASPISHKSYPDKESFLLAPDNGIECFEVVRKA
jgi:hypothetical protein